MLYAGATAAAVSGIPVVGPILTIGSAIAEMVGLPFLGPSFAQEQAANLQARLRIANTPAYKAYLQQQQANRIADANLARRASGARAFVPTTGGPKVGFLSGISKVLGGFGTAISDVRTIASTIGGAIHPAATAAGKAATAGIDAAKSAGAAVARTVAQHPVMAAAAGAGAAGIAAGAMASSATMGKGGKIHPAVAKALGLHKHRRMHATNTKALHRALRRVKGFERVARRVMSITHHRPMKMHFKFRKKRAA
jgi:hypothetical protein